MYESANRASHPVRSPCGAGGHAQRKQTMQELWHAPSEKAILMRALLLDCKKHTAGSPDIR